MDIQDIREYLRGMKQSKEDKLFFLLEDQFLFNPLKHDLFVDYGCADGSLLKEISNFKMLNFNEKINMVGYDLNYDILPIDNNPEFDHIVWTDEWETIDGLISKYYKNPCLLLSSVIHEVLHYKNNQSEFWNDQVFNGKFKTIIIRDMLYDKNSIHKSSSREAVDVISKLDAVEMNILKCFQDKWGHIGNNYKTLLHFLLKHRYVENYKREVEENYFSMSYQEFEALIPKGYKITYRQSYVLPFFQNHVKERFGLEVKSNIHYKCIITKI